MTEKTRGEKTKKKGKEQTVQQRISQEAEGQRTALDKGEGWERTTSGGEIQEDWEDNQNPSEDCNQQWSMWKRTEYYQQGDWFNQ